MFEYSHFAQAKRAVSVVLVIATSPSLCFHICSAPQLGSASLHPSASVHNYPLVRCQSLPHVCWRFDAWNEFQYGIRDPNHAYYCARDVVVPAFIYYDRADEDVEDAATNEAKHERRIFGDNRRDLEFCCRKEVRELYELMRANVGTNQGHR